MERLLRAARPEIRKVIIDAATRGQKLIAIGFWKSADEPTFPEPSSFVDKTWNRTERDLVIKYLKSGYRLINYAGESWCRFGCRDINMGTATLTDGTYVWPEGLAHYLEKHNVRLPKKIVKHILTGNKIDHANLRDSFWQGLFMVATDYDWWRTSGLRE